MLWFPLPLGVVFEFDDPPRLALKRRVYLACERSSGAWHLADGTRLGVRPGRLEPE